MFWHYTAERINLSCLVLLRRNPLCPVRERHRTPAPHRLHRAMGA